MAGERVYLAISGIRRELVPEFGEPGNRNSSGIRRELVPESGK